MKKQGMLRKLKVIAASVFLSTALLGIVSCSNENPYINNPELKNLTEQQQKALLYLQSTGIQIIKQGMRLTFVLQTDCFFDRETREIRTRREGDLDLLARFIRGYTGYFAHPQVSVTGYTDVVWKEPARMKLSLHYAKAIASVLQEDGVAPGIMDVRGEGAKHKIASNQYPMGTAFNRRVEIIIH